MSDAKKYVYSFEEGNKSMKELLGGKGANLAEMSGLGINVPPGFTITTEVCDLYYKAGKQITDEVKEQVNEKLKQLEEKEPLPDKEADQMAWVRVANQHKAIAEEIILKELIYV